MMVFMRAAMVGSFVGVTSTRAWIVNGMTMLDPWR
jgi:hypothetical protein